MFKMIYNIARTIADVVLFSCGMANFSRIWGTIRNALPTSWPGL